MAEKKARVAHVIHDLRPGGTERRLLSVLAGLDRKRFDPLLVCIDELGPLAEDARALGLEPIVLGRARRLDATGLPRLARILRREGVSIVHGWLSLANVFACVSGALARVPVRIAGEGGAITTTSATRARRDAAIDRLLNPLTDAYVANSEAVADALRRRGVPTGKIVVIPNGVAVPEPLQAEERARLREALGAGPQEELIGFVSRLDPGFKDHETFLAAVAALVRAGRPLRAAVVGEGSARGSLERGAAELGIADRVVFTGYRPDAGRLIGALDVSVLLSYSEGFSNVLLESMVAGVPVVATTIPPNREAVEDGVQGLLVPVRNEEATAAALSRLLEDRDLARRVGEAARRRAAERYSPEAQAAATMRLYERLLARKAGRL